MFLVLLGDGGKAHVAGAGVMGPWPPNMMVTAARGQERD